SATKDDARPFVLSTPRLEDAGTVHLQVAFDSESVDELFKLRYQPRPWGEIREMLNLSDEQAECFHSFLTSEPPPKRAAYTGPGLRMRYFGHACMLIETKDLSLLFDPVLSYRYES